MDVAQNTPEPLNFEPINKNSSLSVVLLGSGGEGHSGGKLTDSIIIVNINPSQKKASLISVPRDLWIPGNRKINSEVMVDGYTGLKSTLEGITGLEIKKYLAIDFESFTKLINQLGGIEVEIPQTFDDYFYPIKGKENDTCGLTAEEIKIAHQKYSGFELEKQFPCRWEHIHFEKGTAKINGEEALKLARSRHGDSDFGRSARQFAILKGIVKKISLENLDETYQNLVNLVKTDLDLKTAKEFSHFLGKPEEYQIREIHLSTENVLREGKSPDGQYILLPKAGVNNFEEIKNYLTQKSK